MTDWLARLQSAPSPPPGLVEFAGSQPSLAATWHNATRGDWIVWMAAHGFGGQNSPRDIVNATMLLADLAPRSALRRALHFRADAEDVMRSLDSGSILDVGQIVAHLYLGLALGGVAGYLAYAYLAGRALLVREAAGVGIFLVGTVVIALLVHFAWRASLRNARKRASIDALEAVRVAILVSDRSDVNKQLDGARFMRKRLVAP